jgi:hypothetical protein
MILQKDHSPILLRSRVLSGYGFAYMIVRNDEVPHTCSCGVAMPAYPVTATLPASTFQLASLGVVFTKSKCSVKSEHSVCFRYVLPTPPALPTSLSQYNSYWKPGEHGRMRNGDSVSVVTRYCLVAPTLIYRLPYRYTQGIQIV